ncbi:hypothetical protein, partial [Thiolapillus sp.]|uniref:hypothetical protein n=1 Tax=Thiolapillus sp. TaxID=2017437 RepID=UPI003AF9AB5A
KYGSNGFQNIYSGGVSRRGDRGQPSGWPGGGSANTITPQGNSLPLRRRLFDAIRGRIDPHE